MILGKILFWLLLWFKMSTAEKGNSLATSRTNRSLTNAWSFSEDDILSREASSFGIGGYQYPIAPPSYTPPVYGPPPEYPGVGEGSVSIEFVFNELVIECTVEEPLEHIIWTRFPCPNQVYFGEGIHVADGATVYNDDLYGVSISGYNGKILSTLVIRDPTGPDSSGLYRCEAWPHIHWNNNGYQPYQSYPYYPPVESDVFIIGGNSLLENCYGNLPTYGTYGNKVSQPITSNKKPNNNNNPPNISKIKESLKHRRNGTKGSVDRKDTNAKYLRYNIELANLFNKNPVAADNTNKNASLGGFLPSYKYPFNPRHSDVMVPPKGPVSPQIAGNLTSSVRFDFSGNGNNQTWKSKYGRSNIQVGNSKNLTIESLARKFVFPQNQTKST